MRYSGLQGAVGDEYGIQTKNCEISQLASIASKLEKSGKIIKKAASAPMKTRLLLGSGLVGSAYLLKEVFPDIEALDELYYTSLGGAPIFLTVGNGKNLRSVQGLTDIEQKSILDFIARKDQSLIQTRVNFINKIDDAAAKSFMNIRSKSRALARDLYVGVEKAGIIGERLNNIVRVVDDFSSVNTKGLDGVARRFARGELGAFWELEGAGILKQRGFQITEFSEEFILVNGKKWPGDVSTLSQGKKVLYEMKGVDWSTATATEKSRTLSKIIDQDKIMQNLKVTDQIDDYKFGLRTIPPEDIQVKLNSRGIPWEVLE